jgi:hypothetical protein
LRCQVVIGVVYLIQVRIYEFLFTLLWWLFLWWRCRTAITLRRWTITAGGVCNKVNDLSRCENKVNLFLTFWSCKSNSFEFFVIAWHNGYNIRMRFLLASYQRGYNLLRRFYLTHMTNDFRRCCFLSIAYPTRALWR